MDPPKILHPRIITTDEYDSSCREPISEILPGLFLGNELGAGKLLFKTDSLEEREKALREKKVTHILCATFPSVSYFESKFIYHYVPIRDLEEESISTYISRVYEFIEEGIREGGVFVHCSAGASRSASLVIAYIMKKWGSSYEDALDFVQSKRACVQPNRGFEKELKSLATETLFFPKL
ncbi:MAG: dual specificity protein phosphatase family protein [Chlamydiae bacterium]|nr:dual specificity protein phosphatase family protein [Chlamydiota bacterium]